MTNYEQMSYQQLKDTRRIYLRKGEINEAKKILRIMSNGKFSSEEIENS